MDKKISLIIGASVGGALLVSLVGVSIVLANRPSSLIARAAANTISDAGRFEAVQVAKDVYNGGSIALSANLDEIANDDVAVKAKYYMDASKFKGAFEMTLLEDGEAVFRPKLIYNQDKVTFSCPEIVDGTYGVNIRNLEKNLEGSIFDPDEETDYSLTDEQYEYFLNLKNTLGRDSGLQNEYEKVLGRYSKLAVEKLLKYSDVNKSSETIKAGGEKIRCTVITVSLDEDGLSSVIQDLIDRANDDEELEDLIYRVASNMSIDHLRRRKRQHSAETVYLDDSREGETVHGLPVLCDTAFLASRAQDTAVVIAVGKTYAVKGFLRKPDCFFFGEFPRSDEP